MPPVIDFRLVSIDTDRSDLVGSALSISNVLGEIIPESPIYFDCIIYPSLAESLGIDRTTYKVCVTLNKYYQVEQIAVGFMYLDGANNVPIPPQNMLLQICADMKAYISTRRPTTPYTPSRVPRTPSVPVRR